MIGYFLYGLHVGFQAMTRPIRQRRAMSAMRAVSDAKDAYRRARVRGDKRGQGQAEAKLLAARTAQLRAEIALFSFASLHPRER